MSYTPPSNNALSFQLGGGYSAPAHDAVYFDLGDTLPTLRIESASTVLFSRAGFDDFRLSLQAGSSAQFLLRDQYAQLSAVGCGNAQFINPDRAVSFFGETTPVFAGGAVLYADLVVDGTGEFLAESPAPVVAMEGGSFGDIAGTAVKSSQYGIAATSGAQFGVHVEAYSSARVAGASRTGFSANASVSRSAAIAAVSQAAFERPISYQDREIEIEGIQEGSFYCAAVRSAYLASRGKSTYSGHAGLKRMASIRSGARSEVRWRSSSKPFVPSVFVLTENQTISVKSIRETVVCHV